MENNTETSKVRVKNSKKEFLFLLLCGIEQHGNNLSSLSNYLKKSKQALNYHLKQAILKDFARKIQSYPFAIYELTSLGQRVKEILRHGEDGTYKPLWECHNYEVGFDIYSMGTYQFIETTIRKLIKMNNWHYTLDSVGEFKVQITSTGKMVIHCPRRVTRNPEQEFVKMGSEAQRIAMDYCNRYDMKLSLMKQVRAGQKTLKKSEALAKVLGKFHLGDIWTDNSDGTGEELEEQQDCNKIENLLNLPEQMKQMMVLQAEFSKNIMTHLEVLTKMSNSLDLFNENMKVMNEKLEKLGK